jgi:hypothetical protein
MCSLSVLEWGMPEEDRIRFLLKMSLRKALKLIRRLRRQVSEINEDIMAKKILDELDICGWEIRGGNAGFHFRAAGRSAHRDRLIDRYFTLLDDTRSFPAPARRFATCDRPGPRCRARRRPACSHSVLGRSWAA